MSRLEQIKKQNPNLDVSLIDIITSIDPTKTYKYLDFLIKQFKISGYLKKEEIATYLFGPEHIETLNKFEKHVSEKRIKNNDISSYNSFESLKDANKIAEEIELEKKISGQIKKIHWSDEWIAVIPLTFAASKKYGSGTKWCTTTISQWFNYVNNYKLIYVENRLTGFKVAFSRNISSSKIFDAWTAEDNKVSPLYLESIPDDLFLKIVKELRKNESVSELAVKENIFEKEIPKGHYVSPRVTSEFLEELRRFGITNTSYGIPR